MGSTIDCQAAEPRRMVLPSSFFSSLTTPVADTWRKVRRLMPPCKRSLFMDSPLVGVCSCCHRPFPPGRWRSSGFPTRPLLADEEEENVDQDAQDREDQDDREELRHL